MKQEPEIAWHEILKQLPHLLRAEVVKAKLMRGRYLALLEEGFSEAQALELCKDILK